MLKTVSITLALVTIGFLLKYFLGFHFLTILYFLVPLLDKIFLDIKKLDIKTHILIRALHAIFAYFVSMNIYNMDIFSHHLLFLTLLLLFEFMVLVSRRLKIYYL